MAKVQIRVPCSDDQADIIADHLIHGAKLGMDVDERSYLIKKVHHSHHGARILSADLDLSGEWVLELSTVD